MKKELLIIFIIVVIIVIAHSVTQVYTQKFFNTISEDLDRIEEKIFNSDFTDEELKENIENTTNKWKEKYDFIACFIEHDELEKVQTQLISIRANILVGDYDKSIDETEKCKFILKHIEEKDSLKIINIF